MQTVKDLTIDELKLIVGEVVEEKLRGLLPDPDAGLSLRPEVEARLRRQMENPNADGPAVPVGEVARRVDPESRVAELLEIGRRCASTLKGPAVDHGELLYDERGLPK